MLFFVFGLPGRFSGWCEAVVAALAHRSGGTAEVIRANTLEQIAAAAIRTGASHAVVASGQPGGRLRAAVTEHRLNFIVALDEPRRALLDLVLDQQIALPAAVQQLASGCAVLSMLAGEARALTLHGDRDQQHPTETVAAIARHLRIRLGAAEIAELIDDIAVRQPARPSYDAHSWWNGLGPAEQELVLGALMPFVDAQPGGDGLAVHWPFDLFYLGDRPEERATGPIDITGRARCLVHGPHIVLPPGHWSLSLTARFSREAVEHEFLAEIWADQALASAVIQPAADGSAETALDFTLDQLAEDPVAIRINSRRAAFDGTIIGVRAALARVAAAPDTASFKPELAEP